MNIFLALKRIFDAVTDSHLNMVDIRRKCGREIDSLSATLDISESQCVLLAAIIELTPYDGASLVNLSGGFGCNIMDLYCLMPEFNALIDKGYVHRDIIQTEIKFFVNPEVLEAFCDNRAPDATKLKKDSHEAPQNRNDQKSDHTRRPYQNDFDLDGPQAEVLSPVHMHPVKKLFFSPDVQSQYDELAGLLQKDNQKEINRRLKEAGLNSGFTCLFYGPPGTGKTEAVYQIANATDREIFQADMSQIHGKWVGESEKNARRIFDQYFAKILKCKSTPILLLNEADAIISRRLENADSSAGMMYNRVQNILLQALEDFQGILIATTNLETNFDPAFERRFLFKMQFRRPDATTRALLWKSIIPSITDDDCQRLADEFPSFSGGEIVNVGRKVIIDQAFHGTDITFSRLRDFCTRENLAPHTSNVGFRISA